LEGHIQVFLAEKNFEGCGGFRITDEVRVVIAAQACLLLLHRETDYYPTLRSILVYPDTFIYRSRRREEDEPWDWRSRTRLGQSGSGAVVLSWSSTVAGTARMTPGENVVFHEFAHQLDEEDGVVNGAPLLPGDGVRERHGRYLAWARVLGEEYRRLRQQSREGAPTVLNEYGAVNPAEFFAVATECFFEDPGPLREGHPELYEELKGFYLQDPVTYIAPPDRDGVAGEGGS
jgi:Mlc titration factor MtfA (ptsG expression regulator)